MDVTAIPPGLARLLVGRYGKRRKHVETFMHDWIRNSMYEHHVHRIKYECSISLEFSKSSSQDCFALRHLHLGRLSMLSSSKVLKL